MPPARDAIGQIECPLCKRDAELHASSERPKLDPDSQNGQGRAAYPKKFFIVCPPVKGHRGCGTILANSAEAQAQILDKAHVFGAQRASAPAVAATPPPAPAARPSTPAPEKISTPAPKTAPAPRNPFKLWG
jgi:hypothetical protein